MRAPEFWTKDDGLGALLAPLGAVHALAVAAWWCSAHERIKDRPDQLIQTPIFDTCGAFNKYLLNRHHALQPLRVPVTPERGAKENEHDCL
jgi:hypothetical protein